MSDWKQSLQKTRYVMDVLLLVSFIIISAPKATGIPLHEWLSLLFVIPFLIHLLLHWSWFKKSFSRLIANISLKERINIVWNYVIYLTMLLAFVSGFLISEALLPALNIEINILDFWSKLHHSSSVLLMPMTGIHLALNWSWVVKLTKRMRAKGVTR
ncbi:DUF4405 domain-containing protein [Ferrimonas lipolytica]|uniref:DUF4405 domain-containing protein n=1 Tax=Ferrimonas lipolytica TaxID=2724191 RepID=A0A6H1UFW0_9GAMM|nr:DUF4405 domain-containing protein [Ferrimonas lipolytica]QIZ77934.1 DUF4405 domain-containing protein [Ferrimonas lipolytica]